MAMRISPNVDTLAENVVSFPLLMHQEERSGRVNADYRLRQRKESRAASYVTFLILSKSDSSFRKR